jgi:serine/threonine protein kinase/Flp pilus assembly protein TadD
LERPSYLDPTAVGSSPATAEPIAPHATRFIENLKLHTAEEPETSGPSWPQLPNYEILEVLGEGGMGVVFKARQRALKRTVALKMIGCGCLGPGTRRRFQIEAETVARLHHPNIVQIYEIGEHEGGPYLALEYGEGGSLAQHLAASGAMPVRQAVDLAAQLAQAMQYAHEKGVVHRDLKPANILLSGIRSQESGVTSRRLGDTLPPTAELNPDTCFLTPVPKITDFGLAKLLDEDQSRTRSGAILGTPAYMAPEQAAGNSPAIGPRTDVYALGVILYEMLTGHPPFSGTTNWELLTRVLHDDPAPPSRKRARLARDLDTICLKALAKDPARRYASAGALAADLQRFSAGESIEARPERVWERFARNLRKHPLRVALAFLLCGALLLTAGFALEQRAQAKQALYEGRQLRQRGDWRAALVRLEQGQARLHSLPFSAQLQEQLEHEWRAAKCDEWAAELHVLAEQMRFRHDPDSLSSEHARLRARQCREIWMARDALFHSQDADRSARAYEEILLDLADVALLGLRLELRWAQSPAEIRQSHEEALAVVAELEQRGLSPSALAREKNYHAGQLGRPVSAEVGVPQTAWNLYLHGRALLEAGQWAEAAQHLKRAIDLDPRSPAFYFEAGVCALKEQRFDDARYLFSVCIGLTWSRMPDSGQPNLAAKAQAHALEVCYFKRGLAEFGQWRWAEAVADFTEAIQRNPALGAAYLNRGLVYREQRKFPEALQDLNRALELGLSPVQVHYNLALTYWDTGQWGQARRHLRETLRLPGCPADAANLDEKLRKKEVTPDSTGQ